MWVRINATVFEKIKVFGFRRSVVKGRFADAFANDQDFALYFLLKICEKA